jgi:NADP-dependent 3-hydroxy acid dehydrogenase YdfG
MGFSQKKIALVTGANKGLGLEISRQLAQQGIKVVMAVRNITKGQVAMNQLRQAGLDVELQHLDVTDPEWIEAIRSYKVNSADPDWCRTDMGTEAATYSVEEGADTPVWLATLNTDGFIGGFFNFCNPVPW